MHKKGSTVHAGLWLTPRSARMTRKFFLLVPKAVEKASREDKFMKQEQSLCVLADFLPMGLWWGPSLPPLISRSWGLALSQYCLPSFTPFPRL